MSFFFINLRLKYTICAQTFHSRDTKRRKRAHRVQNNGMFICMCECMDVYRFLVELMPLYHLIYYVIIYKTMKYFFFAGRILSFFFTIHLCHKNLNELWTEYIEKRFIEVKNKYIYIYIYAE